ncbi:MAG: Nif3-like dinuclear metal center hexameric protein [Ruminococcaceae bacterium]|nr:Nif3-like dinuclear metal center hexameric protein [Oscillospiraceae bacterium]
MIKLCEITDYLEKEFPPEYKEDFDNIGLLVGRRDRNITKAVLCLDANKNVVKEAISLGAELIITHHPVIFNPVKKVTDETDFGEMLVSALENGISIYSAHTNLDSAPGGITDTVCNKLNLTPFGNLEGALGRICNAPVGTTAKILCAKIKKEFNIETLYSTFSEDREIKTVAVCNGGGGGELPEIAMKLGADVYISGDLKHHELGMMKANDNIDFIEMRHFDSEKIVTGILENKLNEKFGDKLELHISQAEVSPLLDTDKIS